ncbi:hypothetical protein [Methylobacterium nodulans]|uniref:Uncharacterized protein n=1 Tax=Methylobacterium nodulans (strain LMG 21967 / CNCM I-2342 / ORS 2060) TaxID=460265 RepID=B8IBV6_METNO|nr:hypothetical protein [Methylobacterium nodulans]ACL61138.1 conserved hypothetical protein [Methylobacterium nodulans ORS 2060]
MRRDLIGLGFAVAALSVAGEPALAGPPAAPVAGPALRPAPGSHPVARHPGFRRGRFAGAPVGLVGGVAASEAPPPAVAAEPLLTLPRPAELVPSAWGYGTYGIPTVAGIASPPRAEPVVYVIDGVGSRGPAELGRRRNGSWQAAEKGPALRRSEPARVVGIAVPRR